MKLQRIAVMHERDLFMAEHHQSAARIASNAGIVNHSNPFTRKKTTPQKPGRFIHLLISISEDSSSAQEDLVAFDVAPGRL